MCISLRKYTTPYIVHIYNDACKITFVSFGYEYKSCTSDSPFLMSRAKITSNVTSLLRSLYMHLLNAYIYSDEIRIHTKRILNVIQTLKKECALQRF